MTCSVLINNMKKKQIGKIWKNIEKHGVLDVPRNRGGTSISNFFIYEHIVQFGVFALQRCHLLCMEVLCLPNGGCECRVLTVLFCLSGEGHFSTSTVLSNLAENALLHTNDTKT